MAERAPLVTSAAGDLEQLGAGDTIPQTALPPVPAWLTPPPLGTAWNPMPGGVSAQALTLNSMVVWPVLVPVITLQSIALEVSTLGTGSLLRAGFVTLGRVGGDLRITGLLEDLGTVSAATVGSKTFTSTLTHPGGILWCAAVAQTAACTVRGLSAGHGIGLEFPTAATVTPANNACASYTLAGVTGAIPATSGALTISGTTQPKIFFRRSAT